MKRSTTENAQHGSRRAVWEEFCGDHQLQHAYNIKPDELDSLKTVAALGNIATKDDYLFMLNVMRRSRRRC